VDIEIFKNDCLISSKKLDKLFYRKDALHLAKSLIGKIFVKKEKDEILGGMIVETEAYGLEGDLSAHSNKGKTKRNAPMFEEGGILYVYFTYGSCYCANIVSGPKDSGEAVLIRAVEPLLGIEKMFERRKLEKNEKNIYKLCSGPGKFCEAFGIDLSYNYEDLTQEQIYLIEGRKISNQEIGVSARIGISKSKDFPWRFFLKNNKFVSKNKVVVYEN